MNSIPTFHNRYFLLLASFILYFALGMYRLNDIPGEWYGDVAIHNDAVKKILDGRYLWHFHTSAGPLYHYYASFFVLVFGVSYTTFKLASLIMGALGLAMIFILAKELFSFKTAIIAANLCTVSFWYLVWSRLGISIIITPFLTALTMYLAFRYIRRPSVPLCIAGGMASTLGLFTYPGLFVLPIVWGFLMCFGTSFGGLRQFSQRVPVIIVALLPGFLLFSTVVISQPDIFGKSGYIGALLPSHNHLTISSLKRFASYAIKNAGMLHIQGDENSRWNISGKPHLDSISGILFLVGIFILARTKRKVFILLATSAGILLVPSISPTLHPPEIPSASRTFQIIPLVIMCTAIGLDSLYRLLSSIGLSRFRILILIYVFGWIIVLNFRAYFIHYPFGLLNRNIAYAKKIAEYIDTVDPATKAYLGDLNWAERGQPESDAIFYVLKRKKGRENLLAYPYTTKCHMVDRNTDAVIIFQSEDSTRSKKFQSCFPSGKGITHTDSANSTIFYSYEVKRVL